MSFRERWFFWSGVAIYNDVGFVKAHEDGSSWFGLFPYQDVFCRL